MNAIHDNAEFIRVLLDAETERQDRAQAALCARLLAEREHVGRLRHVRYPSDVFEHGEVWLVG